MAGLPPLHPNAKSNPLRRAIKHTPYTFLGEGTYGTIIQPALPNMNKSGMYSYPNNVTKFYKGEPNVSQSDNFRNTVVRRMHLTENRNQNTIHRYSMYPYHHAYSKENIRSSEALKRRFPDMDKPHMLRLPNLGYSFLDIVNTKDLVQKAINISYKIICQQMLDCMNVVKAIRMDRKIHGDIRETNVMLQPDTGVMTIIDFDFFYPDSDFLGKYSQFFYPHPPECLFVFGYVDDDARQTYVDIWERYKNGISSGKNEHDVLTELFSHDQAYIYKPDEAADGMIQFMNRRNHRNLFEHDEWEELRIYLFNNVASLFIDSYSLAYSFWSLLWDGVFASVPDNGIWQAKHIYHEDGTIRTKVVPEGEDPDVFRRLRDYILNTLLPNMMHADWTKRWLMNTAITEFMNTYYEITGEHLRSYNVSGGSQVIRRGIRHTTHGTRRTQRTQRTQRKQKTQKTQRTQRKQGKQGKQGKRSTCRRYR